MERYSLAEFVNATLGRTHKVACREHERFAYHQMVKQVARYFDILEVSVCLLSVLPPSLNFGVCIVGKKEILDERGARAELTVHAQ